MYCPACGKSLSRQMNFCNHCGANKLDGEKPPLSLEEPRSIIEDTTRTLEKTTKEKVAR